MKVAITIDIDWGPEELIRDTMVLLESFGVKATVFATHNSKFIKSCNRDLFEIGIHPNFNKILNGNGVNFRTVIDELLEIYPEAVGTRSHSLTQNSLISEYLTSRGIIYDCNMLMHRQYPPFEQLGLIRIPYFWEDDVHFKTNRSFEFEDLEFSEKLCNIFDFHPGHIFLNTNSTAHYEKAKQYYMEPGELIKYRGDIRGTRDLFIRLLGFIEDNNIESVKLMDIAGEIKETL